MQIEEAETLRVGYKGKFCLHPNIDREYSLGSHTGDYVCTTCGKTFSSKEEWERERDRTLKEPESAIDEAHKGSINQQ